MDKHIYDKTDKGREEIATRKYHVPAKLRSMLLMIDGHRPLGVLMKNFGPLGLSVDNINELLKDEYIYLANAGLPEPVAEADLAKAHGPSARVRTTARRESSARSQSHDEAVHAAAGSRPGPASGPDTIAADGMSDSERHLAVREFYSQTIKSTLGLRGMMLQLKVEKCAGMDDFRKLRDVYLEAILKAKGREMALSLSGRLDQLLGIEQGEKVS